MIIIKLITSFYISNHIYITDKRILVLHDMPCITLTVKSEFGINYQKRKLILF